MTRQGEVGQGASNRLHVRGDQLQPGANGKANALANFHVSAIRFDHSLDHALIRALHPIVDSLRHATGKSD